MVKELKILNDIYTPPDKRGNQKLVKADVVTRMLINTEDIRYVEEVLTPKAKIIPNVCVIKVDNENFRIQHSFDEIKDLVNFRKRSTIGFKIGQKDGGIKTKVRKFRKISSKIGKHDLWETSYNRQEIATTGGSNGVL